MKLVFYIFVFLSHFFNLGVNVFENNITKKSFDKSTQIKNQNFGLQQNHTKVVVIDDFDLDSEEDNQSVENKKTFCNKSFKNIKCYFYNNFYTTSFKIKKFNCSSYFEFDLSDIGKKRPIYLTNSVFII